MKTTIIIVVYIICGLFPSGSSYEKTTIGELPSGVVEQLFSILTKTSISITGGCNSFCDSDFELALFTRDNAEKPVILDKTTTANIDGTKPLILLIHGWISGMDAFIPEMRDAYLKRYDCNLIMVNWSKLASKFYTTAVCYLPKIAETVATYLCLLNEELKVSIENVHLVGHSLGGQMSGLIGQNTIRLCKKKLGRITALDPAGPLFMGRPINQRLDKTDANYVDVLHTNGGIFGYFHQCGHADFFVNCGSLQLGCPLFPLTLEGIKNLPVSLVTCNHGRSIEYMVESISISGSFRAETCKHCPVPCLSEVLVKSAIDQLKSLKTKVTDVFMGEDSPTNLTGSYVLATGISFPYGLSLKKSIIPNLNIGPIPDLSFNIIPEIMKLFNNIPF